MMSSFPACVADSALPFGACTWFFLSLCLLPSMTSLSLPQSKKTFLTVSAPGCRSLYFEFPDPFSYLYYSLFHVSVACLSFSKRQKQCVFLFCFVFLGISPRANFNTQYTVDTSDSGEWRDISAIWENLSIVVLPPQKLFFFVNPFKPTFRLFENEQ